MLLINHRKFIISNFVWEQNLYFNQILCYQPHFIYQCHSSAYVEQTREAKNSDDKKQNAHFFGSVFILNRTYDMGNETENKQNENKFCFFFKLNSIRKNETTFALYRNFCITFYFMAKRRNVTVK